jgi:hypothetical protein
MILGQVLVAHARNPSYVGGWDQEDHGLRPAWAKSSWDPISKITRAKLPRGVVQVVEYLQHRHWEVLLNSNYSPTKKKKKKSIETGWLKLWVSKQIAYNKSILSNQRNTKWETNSYPLGWLLLKRQDTVSAGKMWKKGELLCATGRNVHCYRRYRTQHKGSSKT